MNITHRGQTITVHDDKTRWCLDCAKVGFRTESVELERFPDMAILEFRCVMGHLQFEELPPAPRPTHVQEHAA